VRHKHAYLNKCFMMVVIVLGVFRPCYAEVTTPARTLPSHASNHHASVHHSVAQPQLHHHTIKKTSVHHHVKYSHLHYHHSLPIHQVNPSVQPTEVAPVTGAPTNMVDQSTNTDIADIPTTDISTSSTIPTTADHPVVSYIHQFMNSLRYTTYRTGGRIFDSTRGIYELDCSHYVDHILQTIYPHAYSNLTLWTGEQDPDSANYYNFFSHLTTNAGADWNKVNNAYQLQPGDILVFRYLTPSGIAKGGHVMVVMDTPTPDNDNDALMVRVSDSAFGGHSDDTRPLHNSGVGIGTLLLKIDSITGQPSAYAWNIGAPWRSSVDIAMARPLQINSTSNTQPI
jgi:cell wall-associated NlpC family hydrolase